MRLAFTSTRLDRASGHVGNLHGHQGCVCSIIYLSIKSSRLPSKASASSPSHPYYTQPVQPHTSTHPHTPTTAHSPCAHSQHRAVSHAGRPVELRGFLQTAQLRLFLSLQQSSIPQVSSSPTATGFHKTHRHTKTHTHARIHTNTDIHRHT